MKEGGGREGRREGKRSGEETGGKEGKYKPIYMFLKVLKTPFGN